MKFTAGYALGATTVIALAVSFIGGAIGGIALVHNVETKKNEKLETMKSVTATDTLMNFINSKRK